MTASDSKKIIALTILIFLYASIPILIFLLIYIGIFDIIHITRFLRSPNIEEGIILFKFTAIFLAALITLKKLLIWIKK